MSRVSHGPDRLRVVFDDQALVANAGLILVATLTARLGLEALVDATVRLGRELVKQPVASRAAPLPISGNASACFTKGACFTSL